MIWLVFIWFTAWVTARVVKTEPILTVALVVLWVIALLLIVGVPDVKVG